MKARQWLINYRGSRTQETVARKIGISRSRLTQIELGDTPSVETVSVPLKGSFVLNSCPRNPLVCLCSEYSLRG